jgi:hypothetical protein
MVWVEIPPWNCRQSERWVYNKRYEREGNIPNELDDSRQVYSSKDIQPKNIIESTYSSPPS